MSNHSIIEHRANYHYTKNEEDFLAICCQGNCSPHCKSLILSILESWMNTKKAKGESDFVYMSIPQWIKYTYMCYERNVISDCLAELLSEKMIERRQIVMFDQKTFEYRLNIKVIQELIRQLPEKNAEEVLPRLDAYLAYKEKRKGVREKSTTLSNDGGVREKSTTVGDKSRRVREKSTRGYVKNQRNLESITNLNLDTTKENTYTDVPSEIGTPSPSPFSLLLESWKTGSHEQQQATLQVLIDAGIIPPVNENDNHSHSSEKVETSSQSQNSTSLPEPSLLPTQQAENASVLHETHNFTPTLENGLEVAKQEASDEICVAPTKRKSKKVLDLVPTPPPAKPLEDTPWSVEKCLAWGDYARKCVFAPSNHPQSKYYKSVEAAKKIIGQGIQENTFLSVYLNWMKGVNLNLEALPEGAICSETWPNYSVDLWVFIEHYEDEARKYKKAKLAQVFQPSIGVAVDLTTQRENARIKNLANLEKMKRIKAKLEEEKQQQAGKKRAAI